MAQVVVEVGALDHPSQAAGGAARAGDALNIRRIRLARPVREQLQDRVLDVRHTVRAQFRTRRRRPLEHVMQVAERSSLFGKRTRDALDVIGHPLAEPAALACMASAREAPRDDRVHRPSFGN